MKKAVLILIIILCFTVSCSKEKIKTDAVLFKEEYEAFNGKIINNETYQTISIPEDNAIVYSSIEEILSLLKEGSSIIYFGAPDDFSSRREIETLLNTANMIGIEKIYYFNVTQIRDKKHIDAEGNIVTDFTGTKEYQELLNILNPFLPSYQELKDETIKRLYFPTIIFIKEGKIIGCHIGNFQNNSSTLLTKEEEKELVAIYSTYMHDILKDACNKDC